MQYISNITQGNACFQRAERGIRVDSIRVLGTLVAPQTRYDASDLTITKQRGNMGAALKFVLIQDSSPASAEPGVDDIFMRKYYKMGISGSNDPVTYTDLCSLSASMSPDSNRYKIVGVSDTFTVGAIPRS